jgi:AcrR family transcriptional regulator
LEVIMDASREEIYGSVYIEASTVDSPVNSRLERSPMAHARTPRRAWIDEGLRALAAGGPEAVRVETLARGLGVTKGGFYGYFADRAALLNEMLDTFEHEGVDAIIGMVESAGGDARAKLTTLFNMATSPDVADLIGLELAVREWARRDPAVADRLRRIDNRRMQYMRSLFGQFCSDDAEVEVRCMITAALYISSYLTIADHGARTRNDVLRLTLAHLLA